VKGLFFALVATVAGVLAGAAPSQAKSLSPNLLDALVMGTAYHDDDSMTITIASNPGGDIQVFQAAAKEVLAEGFRIEIDGKCASACVLLADLARNNICITPGAQMLLHQGYKIEPSGRLHVTAAGGEIAEGRIVGRIIPPESADINAWVDAHGGYPSDGLLLMSYNAARQFWARC
jgi:hypothetical protein